ncbi:MAG TPA: VanZ family protein [Anaerolineales bacterium]|jgi:VanZ family protein|nr:VanZ family protein [Anaerolineales bacterium]
MSNTKEIVRRWLPALLVMLIIFLFSAKPPSELPNFDAADRFVKKGGHMLGYALLALSYWRGLGFLPKRKWVAWCLAIVYAVTDEFHQSFVPGRSPSIGDVLIFDNLGAMLSLWIFSPYKTQRSDSPGPIVEKVNVKG